MSFIDKICKQSADTFLHPQREASCFLKTIYFIQYKVQNILYRIYFYRIYFTQIIYLISLKFLYKTCVIHISQCDPDKRRKSQEIRAYLSSLRAASGSFYGEPYPTPQLSYWSRTQSSPCPCFPLLESPCYENTLIQPAMCCSDPTETSLPLSPSCGLGVAG